MSDPALGLLMLGLIVVVIMMGFPTAFTLMGLGMFFGFFAYYRGGEAWSDNHIFDLMVQRTYGAMTNDVLISIPLFVLMGYVMERGALVDKMFYSIQLAFRRVPASLAVATLIVCTFWGIASGLVGAVVVLMGVIAFNPMLKAGYDVKLASGVITAGGTLGILIPPSVMIIVYAAVAGQSVVKLYAAAMFPGFFLALLYLIYIIGWALINPKIAPKLPESETRVPVRPWVAELQQAYSRKMLPALFGAVLAPAKAMNISADGARIGYTMLLKNFGFALVPLVLTLATLWATWWYVVIHQQPDIPTPPPASIQQKVDDAPQPLGAGAASQPAEEKLEELGGGRSGAATRNEPETLQQMGSSELRGQTKAAPSVRRATAGVLYLLRFHRRHLRPGADVLLLDHGGRAVRGAAASGRLGDAAGHSDCDRAGGDPARYHDRDGIRCGRRRRRLPARLPGPDARLEAHQGGGVPDRKDHLDGVLAVRRLRAVLGGIRDPRRSGASGEAGCCRST